MGAEKKSLRSNFFKKEKRKRKENEGVVPQKEFT